MIMKKILFWSAVAILSAVSCNKIDVDAPVQESSNVPYFEASVDGADTKTVIDGKKSYWDGTEGIRVFDGKVTNGKVYTATVEKTDRAIFTESDPKVSLTGETYLAVYPETPAGSVTWDGNVESAAKNFWLGGDQTPVAGSYDPSTHIAIACTKAGKNSIQFKNVTALVRVELKSDNVTEICFYGNNSDKIAGNFDVKYNEGNPSVSFGNNYYTLTYAKVKNEDGSVLEKGVYYISVLPAVLSKGFSIELVSNGVKSVKKNSKSYTIKRNTIVNLGAIEWVEPEPPTTRTIYFNPGGSSLWDQANAKFQAWVWGAASGDMWVKFENPSNGIYSAEIPIDATGMKVLRKSPSHADYNWDKWNETGDISIPSDKNLLTITGWNANNWKWSNK